MTEREREILRLIEGEPLITQEMLAERLGIQRSSVAVHISNLMKKGYIKGRGYIVDSSPYIVVIGGSNMDIIGTPDKKLIPRDSNIGTVMTRAGGVGRNIAENLSALGHPVHFISAVGQDDFGRKLLEALNQKGIHTAGVMMHSSLPTSTYLCINDVDHDMAMAISQMHIADAIDVNYLMQWGKLIEGARLLVLDTNLSEAAIQYLLTVYSDRRICIDPVSTAKAAKLKGHLDKIHFLKPNLIEAALLTEMEQMADESERDYATRLCEALVSLGIGEVALTLGADGVVVGNHREVRFFESHRVAVQNTTGAGDAFFAGYVHGIFFDVPLETRVNMALRCASHQISQPQMPLSEAIASL
ncbi:winged helix-turn-helix transcriptional regulator [Fusibacter paucivorans]|uniref:Winged helix-turn-helix transcriptional regulator n=1 Tax=Fusibacter paucivorans TaxID=76009 RepID=A0ABS5PPQ8_9FIRM|nr:carbohydrate kinase [Fusibacter paucivorans]MBS7527021.1 winged helix-turn-helix transcriptional regulator [Fusibacter paucivorans]